MPWLDIINDKVGSILVLSENNLPQVLLLFSKCFRDGFLPIKNQLLCSEH